MGAVYGTLVVLGGLLLATAALVAATSSGDLHRRLPLQVPPRSIVRPVVVAGAVLVVLGVVGLAVG